MTYRLVFLSGGLAGRVRDVDAPELVLGRDPQAAQVVFATEDRLVSRRHAMLREVEGALLLLDLGSSTGTFVDGNEVAEAELTTGDVFELGRGGPKVRVERGEAGTIRVEAAPASPAAPATPEVDRRPPAPGPGSRLRLAFLSGARRGDLLELGGGVFRLGRAAGSTVWTPDDRVVSAHHAKVMRLDEGYVLIDLESTNGTFVNGRRVERAVLRDGDIVGLGAGGPELRVQILPPSGPEPDTQVTVVIPSFAELASRRAGGILVQEAEVDAEALVLGRGEEAGLRLDAAIVSRAHACLLREGSDLVVEDLGSANGTYLDGARVRRAVLRDGSRLVIGPFQLVVAGPAAPEAPWTVKVLDTRNRTRLEAHGLTVAAGGRTLLDDVSLPFPPGSFTALIGPSGAGKSTLLAALDGARPAARGVVLLNGVDVRQAPEVLRAGAGYVPQEDIVHRELTVGESLSYTARLRLPPDTSPAERERRVSEVLATLELSDRRDVLVHRLSGGQRKRVSIAAELLTEPNLLFLDEPTSGLDPGLEEALMLLLRELSFKGKTVVLVTHTLEHVGLCDAVALLVGGRLAFHGPAAEARRYFGIDHLANLYARLKQKPAEEWRDAFRRAVPAALEPPPPPAPPPEPRPSSKRPGPGALEQFAILTARYVRTVTRDARNAALLVAQAPLVAGLIGLSLLYGQSDVAYTKPNNTLLFLLALTAVWFGCSNAARELVKERAIYLRERMVGLGLAPYVLSKVTVLGGLALIQCVLFLLILDLWFDIPGSPVLLLASMLLASLVGIISGLALSALVGSTDRAMTLLPILLIPQVLFTIPSVQMDMKGPAGLVARAMPTWWSFDLLRRVALAPGEALDDDTVEEKLKQGGPVLMTKGRFERMLQEGYMMFQYRGAIETTWTASLPEKLGARLPRRLGPWRPAAADTLVLAAFSALLLGATGLLQRRYDRPR